MYPFRECFFVLASIPSSAVAQLITHPLPLRPLLCLSLQLITFLDHSLHSWLSHPSPSSPAPISSRLRELVAQLTSYKVRGSNSHNIFVFVISVNEDQSYALRKLERNVSSCLYTRALTNESSLACLSSAKLAATAGSAATSSAAAGASANAEAGEAGGGPSSGFRALVLVQQRSTCRLVAQYLNMLPLFRYAEL